MSASASSDNKVSDRRALRYLRDGDRQRIIAARDTQQRLFDDLIGDGIASGVFATPYPEDVVLAILTMCSGVAIWYRPGGRLNAGDIARRYVHFALALLDAK